MKTAPERRFAFRPAHLVVGGVVLAVLFFVVDANLSKTRHSRGMTVELANAKSLQNTTLMMTLDSKSAGDGVQWTSVNAGGKAAPIPIATYFDALVRDGYMTRPELAKVLTAFGKGPGRATPTADNIGFKIFWVEDTSPDDQPFVVTRNWDNWSLRKDEPLGTRGFVVFNKGGGGGIYAYKGLEYAASTKIFPAGDGKTGTPYRYVSLK